jgi:hypothetical protein
MSYDPSAKYTRNDLMRLAKVFGVHTTRGAPGTKPRNTRPRPTADLRSALAQGRPVAGRSLATSFQSSDLMQYTMYNLRYFAKQMKVPMTYRGRTKTKAELLKGLTLAAKGVQIPGVSTRKGTRKAGAGLFGKSPRSAKRPASATPRSAKRPASARRPASAGKRTVARLTRNVGASAKSTQVVNRVAMRSLFAETPRTPKTPVTMTTPKTVSPTPRTASPVLRRSASGPSRSLSRSASRMTPTPTLTPSTLMSPTPMTVASPPPRANGASTSRSAARRSARIAKIATGKTQAAGLIPKGKM